MLLSLIAGTEGGEACICDLIEPVGLSQGTVSHHMKLLTDAGLVTREQRGKWAYFALNDGGARGGRGCAATCRAGQCELVVIDARLGSSTRSRRLCSYAGPPCGCRFR